MIEIDLIVPDRLITKKAYLGCPAGTMIYPRQQRRGAVSFEEELFFLRVYGPSFSETTKAKGANMGTDETMRMVWDHAKRLAKLESGEEEENKRISVMLTVYHNESAECYDSASLNLSRLKSLIDWMENLIGDRGDYEAETTRGALQLIVEWLADIIADVDQIKVARPNLFERCQRMKTIVEMGVFDGREALPEIKKLNAEINVALNEDVGQLKKYQREFLEMTELIRESLNQPKKRRASAESQVQTEAQDSNPEGSATRKQDI